MRSSITILGQVRIARILKESDHTYTRQKRTINLVLCNVKFTLSLTVITPQLVVLNTLQPFYKHDVVL